MEIMTSCKETVIPSVADIDFTDVCGVVGYAMLWLKTVQGCCGNGPDASWGSRELLRLDAEGNRWLRHAVAILRDGDISAAAQLTELYSHMERFCRRTPDRELLRHAAERVSDRWLAGDTSVNSTDVVLMIWSVIDRGIRFHDSRFPSYALAAQGKWVEEMQDYLTFSDIAIRDRYRRLSFLLGRNLATYFPSPSEERTQKHLWLEANLLPSGELSGLPTAALLEYVRFLNAAVHSGYLPAAQERPAREAALILTRRPDLHPCIRAALTLDLHENCFG